MNDGRSVDHARQPASNLLISNMQCANGVRDFVKGCSQPFAKDAIEIVSTQSANKLLRLLSDPAYFRVKRTKI